MDIRLADGAFGAKRRLCIDGRLLDVDGTGVATYAAAVQAALTACGSPPMVVKDAGYGRFGGAVAWPERWRRDLLARACRGVRLRIRAGEGSLVARDIFRLAHVRFLRTGKLLRLRTTPPDGIMHWTYPVPIVLDGWSNLYTVHDVIPIMEPEHSAVDGERMRRLLSMIGRDADHLVTVSETARASIIDTLGIAPSTITNCGSAIVDLAYDSQASLPAGLVRGGYYLFCGTIDRRKNVIGIAEAWIRAGRPLAMVFAGPPGDASAELIGRFGGEPALRILPYQPRRVLAGLIAGARALVFPSLSEGFGLPIVEAMALGTPVLTSASGAVAETAADAALLVQPNDGTALAMGLYNLAQNDALCERLSRLGRARARDFSPRAFGARLLALYGSLSG